jgi:phosphoenolpyruvate carboxykinase (GTP)
VLRWIVDRVQGRVDAQETPLGWSPRFADIDWTGCATSESEFAALTHVDSEAWSEELASHADWFEQLGERVPKSLALKRDLLSLRIGA